LETTQISIEVIFPHIISFPPVFSNDGFSTIFSSVCTNVSDIGGVVSITAPSETTMDDLNPTLSVGYTLLYIVAPMIEKIIRIF